MRLKSYSARSVSAAMAQIREELGDEAIIVATHEEGGGAVRVTAAVDREGAPDDGPADAPTREPAETHRGAPASNRNAPPTVGRDEIVDTVYDSLRRHAVPSNVSDPILDEVEIVDAGTPLAALTLALDRVFRFEPFGMGPWATPVMPVGVPGAGKTQTIVKLAVRGLIDGQRVAVLTTDVERTSGLAGLAAFTRALKIDLVTAHDPTALADGLMTIGSHDLILVDTAGANHLNAQEVGSLAGLALSGKIEQFLVLSAGLDAGEASDIALSFREIGIKRLVVTRLDLARRLGSVLAAAHTANIAFAEISNTPMIKNGLAPVSPESLAKLLLVGRGAGFERTGQMIGTAS